MAMLGETRQRTQPETPLPTLQGLASPRVGGGCLLATCIKTVGFPGRLTLEASGPAPLRGQAVEPPQRVNNWRPRPPTLLVQYAAGKDRAMCHYLSGAIDADPANVRAVYVGDLHSHEGIEAGWNLVPGQYREFEWTADDDGKTLTVRVEHGEDSSAYRAAILSMWPTRAVMLTSITHGYANGDKCWYVNGQLHREDGPAIEHANGDKCWYVNGQRHRVDGPAIEYADGGKEWYVNGQSQPEPTA